jgi:hypothetical protein
VVEVDGLPVLVDFTRRDPAVAGAAAGLVRRIGPALRGRWTRRRFLSATRQAVR